MDQFTKYMHQVPGISQIQGKISKKLK